MIGTWQDSLKLAGVATGLWAGAFGWYFIGTHRIVQSWHGLMQRLHLRAERKQAKRAGRRAAKTAAERS